MSFAILQLSAPIIKATEICGYNTPTPVQSRCIPDILKRKDMVVSAQTGTGKTAAFVLPSLHLISLNKTIPQKSKARPRVLILTPTRELASQITTAASKYGKFLQFSIISLVGGMSYPQQIRNLSRPVDIIVATPGRLLDHMRNRRVDLSGIEILIFDEADRMLDMGFIDDVKTIAKATPPQRQTLLFSATVDNKLDNIIRQLLKNPVRIDLSPEKMAPAKIKQELYMTDNENHKSRLLHHFLSDKNVYKAIIFTSTKINADKLARQLREKNYSAAALHGDLKQNVRTRTLDQLRQGRVQFLVATDVAARGIDVSDITHVFNYDLPKFSEDYVHRIGRTGRAGKTGIAISFALPTDSRHVKSIERYTGQPLQQTIIEGLEPTKRFSDAPKAKRPSHGKSHGKLHGKSQDNKDNNKKRFWFKPKSKSKTTH